MVKFGGGHTENRPKKRKRKAHNFVGNSVLFHWDFADISTTA